ncbi:MAG: tetratricopeptide repeat protein [Fibrobacteraceae bacterium]|nr:tetratricopeptide repeat protein [Fibrobacteraceae bacterium]
MNQKLRFFTFFVFLFFVQALFAVNGYCASRKCPGIEEGAKAYKAQDFERAIDEWRSCVDASVANYSQTSNQNDGQNADLLYNLGNAYFRNGNLGFAIYYYKSALRLNPNDEDIQHNLKFAEAMTKDKVDEDEEENPILSGLFAVHHVVSLKGQLFILLGLFWAIFAIFILRILAHNYKSKNICTGIVFGIACIFSVIGASAAYKIIVLETETIGVVTAKDADVTSAPSDKSQTLNTLSEGTSFEILSDQGNFVEIKLGDKVKGFMKKSEIGIVK